MDTCRLTRPNATIALVCPVMVCVVVAMGSVPWGQMRRLKNLLKELSQFGLAHVINFSKCLDEISVRFGYIFRFSQ